MMQERLGRFTCRRCGAEAHGGALYFLYEHPETVDDVAGNPVQRACRWAARWIERELGATGVADDGSALRLRLDGRLVVLQADAALGVAYLSGEDAAADPVVDRIADGLRGRVPDPAASGSAP